MHKNATKIVCFYIEICFFAKIHINPVKYTFMFLTLLINTIMMRKNDFRTTFVTEVKNS